MSQTRRQFLVGATAAAAVGSMTKRARWQAGAIQPTVIATWDYGLQLVTAAQKALAAKKDLLDALEAGVNVVENDPTVRTVGYGGLPNEDGVVQLDAAIMDGRTHKVGSVAALERIKNPISVARKVMERTDHVLLVGAGANAFAKKMGFVEQDLLTVESRAVWQKAKASYWKNPPEERHDTVCCIGMDKNGDLATAVS